MAIDVGKLKCRLQCDIDKTKPTTNYTVAGDVWIDKGKTTMKLCDEITDLKKELESKPKTITKIRYVERKR